LKIAGIPPERLPVLPTILTEIATAESKDREGAAQAGPPLRAQAAKI
jgi:hypothetical protein